MAAIVFPTSPVPGQTFSTAGKTWVYDSTYGWLSTQNANPVAQYIAKVVCVGGETSVDFSNIPANFTDLEVVVTGRDSGASGLVGFFVTLNGDTTGANYYNTMTDYGISPTTVGGDQTTSSAKGMLCGIMCGINSQTLFGATATVVQKSGSATDFFYLYVLNEQSLTKVTDPTGIALQSGSLSSSLQLNCGAVYSGSGDVVTITPIVYAYYSISYVQTTTGNTLNREASVFSQSAVITVRT